MPKEVAIPNSRVWRRVVASRLMNPAMVVSAASTMVWLMCRTACPIQALSRLPGRASRKYWLSTWML